MTRREAIYKYRGGFYKALVETRDEPNGGDSPDKLTALCCAYRAADPENQARLRTEFPMIDALCHWMLDVGSADIDNGLDVVFPGLSILDYEEPDPTGFDILTNPDPEGGGDET